MDVFEQAIEGRQILDVNYHPGKRTIEPHAYGVGSSGQKLLRAFQTNGATESGEQYGWKLFRVDRFGLPSPEPTGDTFSRTRPGYRRGDKAMSRIIAQV